MTRQNDKTGEIAVREKEEINQTHGEPTRAGTYFTPDVDIFEEDGSTILVADVPGSSKEDLEIDLKDGVLTVIAGVEKPEDRMKRVYGEYRVGGYMRRFSISKDIDPAGITAQIKEGVLTVSLPKSDRFLPRKIEVSAG